MERYNRTADLFETLFSYVYMIYSTDTRNLPATREISALESLGVPLKTAEVNFRNLLAALGPGTVSSRLQGSGPETLSLLPQGTAEAPKTANAARTRGAGS